MLKTDDSSTPTFESMRSSFDLAAAAGYLLPFALVVYLALAGGGYDAVVYGQVGAICWWVVLLGALVGVLPLARISASGWLVFALLAALALWTALGISWSESSERSVQELARVASFLGVFALALAVQGRDGLRRTVGGVAAAIGFIAVLSLLSRFHPELFPENQAAQFLDDVESRLSYPLNYWNALAALMAVGIPLLLWAALEARTLVVRAVAAAAVPVLALVAFFTLSRGGVFEIAVAIVAFFVLYPRRLVALPTMALVGVGALILIGIGTQMDALEDGLSNSTAISEGNQMLAITIVVCAVVAVGQVALARTIGRGPGPRLPISQRTGWIAAGVVAAVVIVVAIGAGAPGKISDRVDEFTQVEAPDPTAGASRYESLSGNGRYQLWSSAVDANATDPLVGLGPGTFEYWWTQDRPIDAYARSAHSLYLNSLAEIGIVGMLIVIALVLVPLGIGLRRWLQIEADRGLLAGAVGAGITFAAAAGVDRIWELAVLPVAFLLLAAAIVTPAWSRARAEDPGPAPLSVPARIGVVAIAIVAAIAIAIPTASVLSIRESQADFNAGDLDSALDEARQAGDIEPYAATPDYQEAQILEAQGDLDGAAAAAREATGKESTNWRTWLVLARIQAEQGDVDQALESYDRSVTLNPLSGFFNE